MLFFLGIVLYGYVGKLLVDVIKRLSHKETSIKELKFLFLTLAVLCAGSYFFIGVIDVEQKMISGLREIKPDAKYVLFSFNGFFLLPT